MRTWATMPLRLWGDGPIQFGIGMFIRPLTSVPSYFCRSNIRFLFLQGVVMMKGLID